MKAEQTFIGPHGDVNVFRVGLVAAVAHQPQLQHLSEPVRGDAQWCQDHHAKPVDKWEDNDTLRKY